MDRASTFLPPNLRVADSGRISPTTLLHLPGLRPRGGRTRAAPKCATTRLTSNSASTESLRRAKRPYSGRARSDHELRTHLTHRPLGMRKGAGTIAFSPPRKFSPHNQLLFGRVCVPDGIPREEPWRGCVRARSCRPIRNLLVTWLVAPPSPQAILGHRGGPAFVRTDRACLWLSSQREL